MKTTLLMNFSVDKEKKQIHVDREFAAAPEQVWAAWTQKELLDQWWAPKPWKAKTKSMDFREGGMWIYSMVGPEGEEHFARFDYNHIQAMKSFSGLDAFCDSNGVLNKEFPRSLWNNIFNPKDKSTMVTIVIQFNEIEDLDKLIAMGFKEGFTAAMDNLDDLLSK